ncbi:MAG: PilZ domain-containing protein [Nitrospiria bacterium]
MADKRKSPRLVLSGWVEISRDSREKIEVSGVNIASGGIGVYSPAKLEIDEEVTLTLHFIDYQVGKVPESLRASVKWVKQIGNYYEIGLKFIPLDPDHQALLLSYMESRKKEFTNE